MNKKIRIKGYFSDSEKDLIKNFIKDLEDVDSEFGDTIESGCFLVMYYGEEDGVKVYCVYRLVGEVKK